MYECYQIKFGKKSRKVLIKGRRKVFDNVELFVRLVGVFRSSTTLSNRFLVERFPWRTLSDISANLPGAIFRAIGPRKEILVFPTSVLILCDAQHPLCEAASQSQGNGSPACASPGLAPALPHAADQLSCLAPSIPNRCLFSVTVNISLAIMTIELIDCLSFQYYLSGKAHSVSWSLWFSNVISSF